MIAQVLWGHRGDPRRVTDGSKTWPGTQTQVPCNVRLPTTPLLMLSKPMCISYWSPENVSGPIGCTIGLSQGPKNVLLRCDCGREIYI